MAKTQAEKPSESVPAVLAPNKLPKLSKNQKIQKRPLLHPPIASPRTNSSTPKIVYVSAKSPFISIVKRVQKLLGYIESRSGPTTLKGSSERQILKNIEDGLKEARKKGKGGAEQVVMKGTGKAIEKVLALGVWFQGLEGVEVRVRTSSVGAVDDVVGEEVEEGGESRVRRVSCLEVGVALT